MSRFFRRYSTLLNAMYKAQTEIVQLLSALAFRYARTFQGLHSDHFTFYLEIWPEGRRRLSSSKDKDYCSHLT
jgi:hypothetical protein